MPDGVIYLNHGSFGPVPRVVQEVREEWSRRLNANPMDFFLRAMEPALDEAAASLGQLVETDARNPVFVENSTVAMNDVAGMLPFGRGNEVHTPSAGIRDARCLGCLLVVVDFTRSGSGGQAREAADDRLCHAARCRPGQRD